MLRIIAIILLGTLLGFFARKMPQTRYVGNILSVIIMLLLFFLGVAVGNNEQVINNFSRIGSEAFVITIGGTLGSVLLAWLVYAKFFKKNREKP